MNRKLPDWVEGYLEYTAHSEPPTIFHKWVAISTIASVMERKVRMEWEKTIYPNMFIVLAAKSGVARKGTALEFGERLMRHIGVNLAPNATSKEALIARIREVAEIGMVGSSHEPNAAVTILSPELTTFLGYENVEMMTYLIDWYDCKDPWEYRTMSRGTEEIRGLWVNLLGASTPQLLQRSIPGDIVGGGLASRVIFVFAERDEKTVVFPWIYYQSKEAKELHSDLTSDLSAISTLHGTVEYDETYLAQYEKWYVNMKAHPPLINDPNLSSYSTRRAMHLHKLSIILSASASNNLVLTEREFIRAANMLEEVEQKMPRVFMGAGQAQASVILSNVMEAIARNKTITRSKLLEMFYQDLPFGSKSLDDYLMTIQRMGFATVKMENVGGQLDQVIRFNENHGLSGRFD